MSTFRVALPFSPRSARIGFPTFVSIVKGTSIVSVADSDHFIEFGISEKMNVRIKSSRGEALEITVVSTLNPDDVPPVRLQLLNDDEEPAAAVVEGRLHSLRQVYAITLLLDSGRHEELAAALLEAPGIDVEGALLHANERLYLQAAGPGSWWVTALTKIKGAPQTALNGLSLIYGEGRHMLLERVRAGTQMKLQAAERERDQRIIQLSKALDKVKDPDGKAAVQQRLLSEMNITNPRLAGPTIAGLLPPPEKKKRAAPKKKRRKQS